ncbi:unnamed protein product [Linum trigynum]|uniref:Reverse transcriptase zinc-binding domain-containing protein n=1 Tax=Linum trigynum TaxID=586398 RepID=A0AAV2FGX5_9ROSI
MESLIEKDVQVHPRCPVCWEESEIVDHLFLDCPGARALWDYVGMEHLGQWLPRHTFPLFLKKWLAIIQSPHQVMAFVVVFEGKQFQIPTLMRQHYQLLNEWTNIPKDSVVSTLGIGANSAHPASLIL